MIYCAFAVLAFVAALSLVPTSEPDDWEDYQAPEPPRRVSAHVKNRPPGGGRFCYIQKLTVYRYYQSITN